jgi:TonB-dependent SusC/RagA subfamily outer membrane receptor
MKRSSLGWGLTAMFGLIASMAIAAPAAAQGTGTLTVTVTDRTNSQAINGARVIVEGTTLNGLTDGRGVMTLTGVPAGNYEIRVLSIGYRRSTQRVSITAGGTAELNYQLGLSTVSLDDIVVTGTGGAVEKRKLGATLGTVDVDRIRDIVPLNDLGSVLRSRIPGVRSIAQAGGVGAAQDLKVRGIASFSLNQRPVVYIDGVRVDTEAGNFGDGGTACCSFNGNSGNDRLSDLNPEDIDRVEVIKGAAAATLYGTEASNGVIQIFTKKGRRGSAPQWSATYNGGINRLRSNLPTKEYPRFTGADGTVARDANTLIKSGAIQRGDITVQGGGETVNYFISSGLGYEQGSIQPNDKLQGNLRLNLSWTASDRWNFEMQTAFTKNRNQLLQSGNNWTALLGNALLGNPTTASAERPYGEPWVAVSDIEQIQSESYVNRWTGGMTANFNPTENFGHRLTVGLDQVGDRRERFYPFGSDYIYVGTDGERSVAYRNFSSYTMDYLGTLGFNLSVAVLSDFSFGAQGFWEIDRDNTAIGEGFAGQGVTTVTGAAVRSGRESFREEINVGLFAQNRFSISDRLFVTAGARLDGNSAFGENFGLQFYPKGEAAYMVIENASGFLSSVKVRSAVGTSGLAPGAFDQFRTFTPTSVLEGQNGVRPNNPGNADLEPEKTTEIEGGFDIGLFDDRFSIEATYYYAKTKDALLNRNLPPSLGFSSAQQANLGVLENKGWEVKIDAAVIETADFRWFAGLNLDGNTNTITDLGEFAECNADRSECKLGNFRTNNSVGALYTRSLTGYTYDAATNTHDHTRTDTTEFVGDPLPSLNLSLNNSFEIGAFRLYGLVTAEKGAWFSNSDRPYRTRQRAGDEYWSLVGDDGLPTLASDSILNYFTRLSSIDERDNLRIREVSLAYQVSEGLSDKLGLGRTSMTVAGQNLMWWDSCNCSDPNMAYRGGSANTISTSGFLAQPQPRTFVFTLRTTF